MHRGLARKLSKVLRRWFNLPAEDATQIGCLGLLDAARKFEPEYGNQFSTYATWWVRQSCQRRGPDAALMIHLPHHIFWGCFKHAIRVARAKSAGGPAAAALVQAEWEAADPKTARRWADYLRVRGVLFTGEREVYRQAVTVLDCSPPVGYDLTVAEDSTLVCEAVNRLHSRFADVIRRRFGLNGEPQTLDEVGQVLGVTRERVRQIEARALQKLRAYLGVCLTEPAEPDDPTAGDDAALPAFVPNPAGESVPSSKLAAVS